MKELLELKITGLRKLAKEYEIPNFSSMTKAELINYVAIEQKGRTSSKIKIEAKPKDDLSEDVSILHASGILGSLCLVLLNSRELIMKC